MAGLKGKGPLGRACAKNSQEFWTLCGMSHEMDS